MKKILTLTMLAIILCMPLTAEDQTDSPWNIQAEFDMYLGAKIGIRYEMTYKLDLVTGIGLNPFTPTQYCYSLYASYRTMDIYDTWNLGINAGIIQGVFDNTSDIENRYFYINPGLTMYVSYPIGDKLRIGAQGGMVIMIGHDQEDWWTSLEPFMGISLIYSE